MSSASTEPEPKSILGRHRVMAATAAVRVSPLCLGCMNFGDAWKGFMGECNKETTFEILDFFYGQEGNFLDTANMYQNEESEKWVGEWMELRGVRDRMVVATKFTGSIMQMGGSDIVLSNTAGNHHKSLHISLEASLKKLRTSYVDILYVHWWDFTTSIEELMQSLNYMVASGKVLYLGISDTPAYIVTKANQYARDHGLRPFSIYQGRWSARDRDFEREILPMCELEGMAIAPWGALGGGMFKTAEQRANPTAGGRAGYRKFTARDERICDVLERLANKKGTIMTSIALAYVRHQSPYSVFPIVGGRNVDQLKGNIAALEVKLTQEEIEEIEDADEFDIGFPRNMLFMESKISQRTSPSENFMLRRVTHLDIMPHRSAIPGHSA